MGCIKVVWLASRVCGLHHRGGLDKLICGLHTVYKYSTIVTRRNEQLIVLRNLKLPKDSFHLEGIKIDNNY
jgi:hypothetical protein